jgi:hypothetical protein
MSVSAVSSAPFIPNTAPTAPAAPVTQASSAPAAKPVDRPHDGDADDRAATANPAAKSSSAVQAGLSALKVGG